MYHDKYLFLFSVISTLIHRSLYGKFHPIFFPDPTNQSGELADTNNPRVCTNNIDISFLSENLMYDNRSRLYVCARGYYVYVYLGKQGKKYEQNIVDISESCRYTIWDIGNIGIHRGWRHLYVPSPPPLPPHGYTYRYGIQWPRLIFARWKKKKAYMYI